MDEEDSCLTSAAEEICLAYEPGVQTSCYIDTVTINVVYFNVLSLTLSLWLTMFDMKRTHPYESAKFSHNYSKILIISATDKLCRIMF